MSKLQKFYFNGHSPVLYYRLIFSDINRLIITVKSGYVILKVPRFINQFLIDLFLRKNYLKLQKNLQKFQQTQKISWPTNIKKTGSLKTFFGSFTIKFNSFLIKSYFNDRTFFLKVAENELIKSEKILFLLLIKKYLPWFQIFFDKVIQKHFLKFKQKPKLILKNFKSRWGCFYPSKNMIALNIKLLCTTETIIEYVLIHEIVHALYPSLKHSTQFWKKVIFFCPDYKKNKLELKKIRI